MVTQRVGVGAHNSNGKQRPLGDRYVRMIHYERDGDRVTAHRVVSTPTDYTRRRVPFREIAACEVDPEFEIEWLQHVAAQPRFWVKP